MRIPEIGRDIAWIDVIRQVFRVIEFDRAGTTIGSGDTVKAKSRFKPYGYLLVESPILNHPTKLPIVHRDDFVLAATVFDEPHLADLVTEDELIVTYVPRQKLPSGHALGPSHVLHYVLVPSGTLNEYYDAELPYVNADIMKMLDAEEREDWRRRMLARQRHE